MREVRQLFVVEKFGRRLTYDLCALTRDGKRQTVATVREAFQARFLEHQLETAMHIIDQPVVGEMRR